MPDDSRQTRRRNVLKGIGGLALAGVATSVASGESHLDADVRVTIDNVGASAWEITNVEGDETVGPTGVENPTLTFREDTRYAFVNEGWSSHPLAFRKDDNDHLLSQAQEGSFEGDSETDWVDEETELAFTVTGELADELDNYVCTAHGSMEGAVEIADDNPAAVEFQDQTSDGTSVVVDSYRMDEGGFITIHDSSLLDGEVIPSVVGVSDFLEAGSDEDLTVELDDPIEEGDTLIAMPHRDTNDNEEYDFVDTEGDEDGPYLDEDGNAIIDDADVEVDSVDAAVTFSDQTSDGTSVVIDSYRMADGGFITIHDSSLLDGEVIPSVVGVSDFLEPGSGEDLTVEFDDPIEEDDTLIAMPHRDTNDNEEYDFVESEGDDDGPYLDGDGGAVIDDADVQVEDDDTMDDDETMDDDDDDVMDDDTMNDDDDVDDADDDGPGFGPIAGIAGVGGAAAYAYRKLGGEDEEAEE